VNGYSEITIFHFHFSLRRDNTPTVVLAEWESKADYFEDDFLSGVSPVLFANDPKAAEDAIRANQETAKKDLDRRSAGVHRARGRAQAGEESQVGRRRLRFQEAKPRQTL
jgi:hypothetical protein